VEPLRVFFVPAHAAPEQALPAVAMILIDSALAHRYGDVCEIEVHDPPAADMSSGLAALLTPLHVIDARESPLYPDARRAVIVRDRRSQEGTKATGSQPGEAAVG
jgi:hypothetical protein